MLNSTTKGMSTIYLESPGSSSGVIPSNNKKSYHYTSYKKMLWPDGISYNKDGCFYCSTAQLHLAGIFKKKELIEQVNHFTFFDLNLLKRGFSENENTTKYILVAEIHFLCY